MNALLRESVDALCILDEGDYEEVICYVDRDINSHLLLFQLISIYIEPRRNVGVKLKIVALPTKLEELAPDDIQPFATVDLSGEELDSCNILWSCFNRSDVQNWAAPLRRLCIALPYLNEAFSRLIDLIPDKNSSGGCDQRICEALRAGPLPLMKLVAGPTLLASKSPFDLWEWLAFVVRLSRKPLNRIWLDGPSTGQPDEILQKCVGVLIQPENTLLHVSKAPAEILWGGRYVEFDRNSI